jgi:hypothetical protein
MRQQAREEEAAQELIRDALALEDADTSRSSPPLFRPERA